MAELIGTKTKSKSLTVVSSVVGILVSIAGVAGYVISPEDAEQIVVVCTSVGTLITSAVALYGRLRATQRIK